MHRSTPLCIQIVLLGKSCHVPKFERPANSRGEGISEYRSKYKGRTTRSRSDSPHRKMRLAGLRSDQSRITQEPQFISKRKVPFYPPQISSSFRWEGHDPSQQSQEKSRPVTPPAVTPVLRASSVERVVTPLAPRDPVPPEGTTAPSQQLQAEEQAAQTSTTAADQQQQRLNGINHVLRKRAGLRSERQRNGRLSSEYQRQFMWKTPAANSPLLAAHEMLYSNNRAIPPFKSNPVIMESEYKRSFKGSPPPRPPRLRRDVEQHEVPQLDAENNTTPEKSKRNKKKKKEQRQSRKSSPEEEVTHRQQQEVRSPCALRDSSPKVMRKGKTEYRSNFLSPLQYSYRDGAWAKIKTAKEEVQELREKADAYRKRAGGTHFSRQHLNQILSDHNWMWEPSSGTSSSSSIESEACRSTSSTPIIEALDLARTGSIRGRSSPGPSASVAASRRSSPGDARLHEDPTLPVQRKLAWDEEEGLGDRDESEISQEELTVEKNEGNPKDKHGDMKERNERLQVLETESSSVVDGSGDSIIRGRLPTPKLRTMQTVQRTHHDRTTPATGGALLVSPPNIKHSSRRVRRSEPPLGKPHSPYKHIIVGSPQRPHSKAESGSLPHSSPAAGLTTVDPLPMREDAWSEEEAEDYSTNLRQPKPSQRQQSSHRHRAAVPPPANRIQGTMRNPEFQHNGNLGIFRPELFVFPEAESSCVSDNGKITSLILADISSHKQLVTVTSLFYVCLAVLVGTGIRSTCALMW
ncbi:nuclear protein MDM1 isoform X4 [Onychostoma macrolepis]|uniref:nuclear protein MDM1 isoform X4 n=1 Tax=Onychostoma macrolepis TaxID=369639 RepID=UPI0027297AD6|nr:nuclear protein MDM1 isoform X4 [Onychostoma macrolepis]